MREKCHADDTHFSLFPSQVTYLMKAHHTLKQNVENIDSEDDSGPNSYPVYQMEQQTLNMGQISTTPL